MSWAASKDLEYKNKIDVLLTFFCKKFKHLLLCTVNNWYGLVDLLDFVNLINLVDLVDLVDLKGLIDLVDL